MTRKRISQVRSAAHPSLARSAAACSVHQRGEALWDVLAPRLKGAQEAQGTRAAGDKRRERREAGHDPRQNTARC